MRGNAKLFAIIIILHSSEVLGRAESCDCDADCYCLEGKGACNIDKCPKGPVDCEIRDL